MIFGFISETESSVLNPPSGWPTTQNSLPDRMSLVPIFPDFPVFSESRFSQKNFILFFEFSKSFNDSFYLSTLYIQNVKMVNN